MQLFTGPVALDELPAQCDRLAPSGERVLLTDDVAKVACGRDLNDWVGELIGPHRHVVVGPSSVETTQLILDEATVESAVSAVGSVALVVSVGSGTMTDLGKVVSARTGAPLIAVQTAASVNGFSDPLSVLVIGGAKRTKPSAWPAALVIDDRLIDAAPVRLNRSGVGDAIAIWSAPADWLLACSVGMDGPFLPEAVDPVIAAVERLADPDPAVARAALVELLTVGGQMIGVANSTAPLSGSEHLVSHILDMTATARGVEHDLHGAQVGVATVVCTALWHEVRESTSLFERPWADLHYPDDMEQRVRSTWAELDPSGALGEECWTAVARKVAAWEAADKSECDSNRTALVERLFRYVGTPERSTATLRHWSAACTFAELDPPVSHDQLIWTLLALPYMRDRLTLPDLVVMTGEWTRDLTHRIVNRPIGYGSARRTGRGKQNLST